MRWKMSILSFVVTFVVGTCVGMLSSIMDKVPITSDVSIRNYAFITDYVPVTDYLWPAFTKDEAAAKIGRRVRLYQTEKFRMMKCLDENPCLVVTDGEYGTVIGIEPVPRGGYFLKVRWDHPTNNYMSYFGRYTHRESLVEP